MKKPYGYWTKGKGAETLDAVRSGELTRDQAAEMEDMAPIMISRAMANVKALALGTKNRGRRSSAMKFHVTKPEQAIKILTAAVEEFAAMVLKDTNADMLRQISEQASIIARQEEEIVGLGDALAVLKAAALTADHERAQSILRRAGIQHGD